MRKKQDNNEMYELELYTRMGKDKGKLPRNNDELRKGNFYIYSNIFQNPLISFENYSFGAIGQPDPKLD